MIASSELAVAGGFGCELNLNQVPVVDATLNPEVIACSETQERFCMAVPKSYSKKICDIFNVDFAIPTLYPNAGAYVIATDVNENSLKKPNYLKIDTQSSEIEILKGLEEIINYESLYFIELEVSLYQINEGAPTINEVIDFMSMNNFLLISTEQLPIVEYFNEKKLVQLNGIFAQRKLITTN